MSFNYVICHQFASLIKKNVDWVIFTVFFLIKMYSTVFQNKQHNCAWHVKMVTSSRDATYTCTTCDCSQILRRPEMHRHSQGHRLWSWTWSEKNWFYGGSSLLVDVYTLGLTTFDAFQIPQCYYRTFNPLFGVNVVNQLFFIRFRSESQIIAGPNLYLCRPRRDRSFKRCSLVNAVIFMGVICSCSDDRNCGTEGSLVINHGSITFQHSG